MPKHEATLQHLREANRAMQELQSHSERPFSDFQKLVDADELKQKLFQEMSKFVGIPVTKNIMDDIESSIVQQVKEFGEEATRKNIAWFESELRKRNSQKLERKNGN